MNDKVPSNRRESRQTQSQAHHLAVRNIRFARRKWGVSRDQVVLLKDLTEELELSVAAGHLRLIDSSWYVTHAGLLRIARRNRCSGIHVRPSREFSDAAAGRWVFKAVVYKSPRSRGFVGYGDADPSNVSPVVQGAAMRIAETRAVNRALRKAYGIGLCSVEELGSSARPLGERSNPQEFHGGGNNCHQNGQPRLRDRLCLLIRQHELDAGLVKAYAANYCGTAALRDASRDMVEAFIQKLSAWAATDRGGLVCHLNSFVRHEEVTK